MNWSKVFSCGKCPPGSVLTFSSRDKTVQVVAEVLEDGTIKCAKGIFDRPSKLYSALIGDKSLSWWDGTSFQGASMRVLRSESGRFTRSGSVVGDPVRQQKIISIADDTAVKTPEKRKRYQYQKLLTPVGRPRKKPTTSDVVKMTRTPPIKPQYFRVIDDDVTDTSAIEVVSRLFGDRILACIR